MFNAQCSMVNGNNAEREHFRRSQWSTVNGQRSMVNGQWSTVNGQWSMVNGNKAKN
jgi:hypothetical protein